MPQFDLTLFLILLAGLSGLYLLLGYRAATSFTDHEDYLLSGRSLGALSLTMTIVATQLGGGTLLGSAEEAYRSGWSVLLYPLGSCLGLLLLASGFGARMRNEQLTTVSELFEKIYKSPFLRRFSSILSILSLFIILIAQGIAARKFLHSLGVDNHLVFISCWAILITYTIAGGLRAVVNTDIVQAIFILGAFIGALFLCSGLNQIHFDPHFLAPSTLLATHTPWSSWLLMPLCFMLIEQDIGQRLFAAKNKRSIRIACLSSCLLMMMITALPIALGNLGHQLQIVPSADGSILLTVIHQLCPPSFSALFACAILMAILSTADSLLCSITSNLTFDFPLPSYLGGGSKLQGAKWITLLVGMISILLSYLFDNVMSVLIFSYELSVAILFVPVVLAFLWPGAKRQAAIASCLTSAIVYIICLILSSSRLYSLASEPVNLSLEKWASCCSSYGVWFAMVSGLLAYLAAQYVYGHMLLPKKADKK